MPFFSSTPLIDTKSVYPLKEEQFKKNFIPAPCCKPIPGDKVFGFINDKNEVEVHKRSCETGMRLKSNFGDRIVEVEWGDYRQYSFFGFNCFHGNRSYWDTKQYFVEIIGRGGCKYSKRECVFERWYF